MEQRLHGETAIRFRPELGAIALAASLLVGLTISILQTITSIQEQTLSFVPRLLAVGLVLVVVMPWTMQIAIHFTMRMLERAAGVGR